ncbi:Ubiquitin conjugation factor E4 [Monoraphidium neglectum]|uniref:Ubiquitin conjugation factor E4 n=1 Tax=Monoraphidium neglectum TaxID=145388 RepID=A0A0D2IYJ7_9CHLO|nr:Ubiquitin conjugation factor E4 [Monoraphidium neglectum]KIY92982.1 Ubiquitin conjugation factor E4 [Monoraphidium neglectum]|eukprot:XP_013892002.1 Ubiquitin conjugation factor E4 [Monoraphidium neglectum]
MRHDIDLILEELWRDAACRDAIRAVAARSEGVLSEFLSAVLNDLMYLFKDSLERLADIKTMEDSAADKKSWEALSSAEREDKSHFLENQARGAWTKRMAKSYMGLSITTLRMLDQFAGDAATAAPFMKQPLLGLSAYAALHFIELLVGPRCATLAVRDPSRFLFDRSKLMSSMAKLVAQLGARQEFVAAMVREPDFEAVTLEAGIKLLNENHQYALGDALAAVLKRTADAAAAASPGAGKRRRGGAEADTDADKGVGGEAMAVDGGQAAAAPPPAGAVGAVAAAAGGGEAAIDALVASWALPGAATYEEAEGPYKEALSDESVGTFDAGAAGAYNSHFSAIAAQAEGDTAQKMRRLGQEFRKLRGATALPLNAAAAIFVRQDEDRPDKARAAAARLSLAILPWRPLPHSSAVALGPTR